MDRFDDFRIEILRKAKAVRCLHIRSDVLATEFDMDEKFVRELLLELHSNKFIRLSAWDGRFERTIERFPNADSFFTLASDGGHKRIRLMPQGVEFLESLRESPNPKQTGFTA